MPYVIDRGAALVTGELVAIMRGQRRLRCRVILRDNSLYQTRTRPRTLARHVRAVRAFIQVGARRGEERRSKGAIWQREP